eukprot:CAMPEP_0169446034 /NCGR_PEP_ID=MMETSP1042-20121227/10759_1 /TAXON_ID=464988 /ORGANISM="Hemiselmis andersenii, Strain CCMP1180" /LENGTH=236 /DNA_ID=CAMNT_0009557473 /DNA_START=19 /DNA_END=725 /DNA_ORIENTATION=-
MSMPAKGGQLSLRRGAVAMGLAAAATLCMVVLRLTHWDSSMLKGNELLMPWYEVASSGDGISPESVNVWTIPPRYFTAPPAPVHQDVTKWNGDHVLNGGNKEWAEEDAALHAFNMENWRNRILETQADRQKKQWRLQNYGKSGFTSKTVKVTPQAAAPAAGLGSGGASLRAIEKGIAQRIEKDMGLKTTGVKQAARAAARGAGGAVGGAAQEQKVLDLERSNRRKLNEIMRKMAGA